MNQANEASRLETTMKKTTIPPLPLWPTSRPGPMITEPAPGQKRVPLRKEQVVELNYDQERGMPATSRTEE